MERLSDDEIDAYAELHTISGVDIVKAARRIQEMAGEISDLRRKLAVALEALEPFEIMYRNEEHHARGGDLRRAAAAVEECKESMESEIERMLKEAGASRVEIRHEIHITSFLQSNSTSDRALIYAVEEWLENRYPNAPFEFHATKDVKAE